MKKPATLTLLIVLYKFASIVNFFKYIYIYIYIYYNQQGQGCWFFFAETYVGKTTQRLSERIKQHIPPNIATRKSNQADSAILAHIRNKPACVPTNAQERFRILARARSSYHLDILEAMYIRSLEPSLCAQKEFVKSLTLFT